MKSSMFELGLTNIQKYDKENPLHFIHEIKSKGYDVIGGNVFHGMLISFHRKKG